MGAMHLQRVLVAVAHPGEYTLPEFYVPGGIEGSCTSV